MTSIWEALLLGLSSYWFGIPFFNSNTLNPWWSDSRFSQRYSVSHRLGPTMAQGQPQKKKEHVLQLPPDQPESRNKTQDHRTPGLTLSLITFLSPSLISIMEILLHSTWNTQTTLNLPQTILSCLQVSHTFLSLIPPSSRIIKLLRDLKRVSSGGIYPNLHCPQSLPTAFSEGEAREQLWKQESRNSMRVRTRAGEGRIVSQVWTHKPAPSPQGAWEVSRMGSSLHKVSSLVLLTEGALRKLSPSRPPEFRRSMCVSALTKF